ncbi:MAG: cyclase family protein [Alphaproteobacteria bacterium]
MGHWGVRRVVPVRPTTPGAVVATACASALVVLAGCSATRLSPTSTPGDVAGATAPAGVAAPCPAAATTTTAASGAGGAGPALLAALAAGKVVDLTHVFDETTVYWPTEKEGFRLEVEHDGPTPGGWHYSANRIHAPEHGGTHMDAPIHFAEGRLPADRVPLDALIGPAVVVDVSAQAAADRDYRVAPADLRRWESAHGRIPDGAIVVMRSGWDARWPDRERVLGTAVPGDVANLHFPSFSVEAARWLLRERRVAGIAVDTPSIDYGPSKDFVVHRTRNGADKPGFENLAGLGRLPEAGAVLVVLPMKVGGGSGGPARVVAILP